MLWPIFDDERSKALKKEMLIFTKSRVAMESLPPKRDEEQTYENNKECMLF